MKYCHMCEQIPEGSRYEFRAEFNPDTCCGKPARGLAWGEYPMCAEHLEIVEAVDAEWNNL